MTASTPRFLVIGQVLRPHGIRGELRVRVITNYPERFKLLDVIALAPDPEQDADVRVFSVERVRLHQGDAIIKVTELDERDDVFPLQKMYVLVPLAEAVPLEPDEFYHYQLVGLSMYTDSDEYLGDVSEILETGANDVYVVQGPRYGEILIPAIESVVQTIDLESGRITIAPIEGPAS